jgi:hypothetical protein
MRIRLVLLAVLALLPWQAGAQTIVRSPAWIAPLICQLEPGPEHGSGSMALCVWSAAIEAVAAGADEPGADQPAGSWLRPGWGYKSGATLFVVGNVVAFSFPLWLALGADAITITGVIIAGELIEAVGIFMLGEDALHAIKDRLVAAVDQMRGTFRDWKATSAESWTAIAPERWTTVSFPNWD